MRVVGLVYVAILLLFLGSWCVSLGGWVNMPLVFVLGVALLIIAATAGSLAWMASQREE